MEVTIGLNDKGKEGHTVISTDAQVFIIFCVVSQCRSSLIRMVEKDLENQERIGLERYRATEDQDN